jgi:hypothetical protein
MEELEIIMLSEIRLTKKDKYCIFFLMSRPKRKKGHKCKAGELFVWGRELLGQGRVKEEGEGDDQSTSYKCMKIEY